MLFIWHDHGHNQDSPTVEFRIRQYDLRQNYQQIVPDQPDLEGDMLTNPVMELMEESGPLNISKKFPNIARTLDGICAFTPDRTISFRFEDSYQYVASKNIIAITK
jgi:hypothetical protein